MGLEQPHESRHNHSCHHLQYQESATGEEPFDGLVRNQTVNSSVPIRFNATSRRWDSLQQERGELQQVCARFETRLGFQGLGNDPTFLLTMRER